MPISIHAPAKGATQQKQGKDWLDMHFNPRSREGSDVAFHAALGTYTISIHAPAKGATVLCANASTKILFQSTLPRRERRE